MSYEFKPGMKVVCIYAGRFPHQDEDQVWGPSEAPVEGRQYTLRHVFVDDDGDLCVKLIELERDRVSKHTYGLNIGYAASRFRPLEEKKYSIEIFREITRRVNEGRPLVPDDEKVDHLIHSRALRSTGGPIPHRNTETRRLEPQLFQQQRNRFTVGR